MWDKKLFQKIRQQTEMPRNLFRLWCIADGTHQTPTVSPLAFVPTVAPKLITRRRINLCEVSVAKRRQPASRRRLLQTTSQLILKESEYMELTRLTMEANVRSQVSPYGMCGGQNGIGTDFSPNTSRFPVSIIPPVPHTHSFMSPMLHILSNWQCVVK